MHRTAKSLELVEVEVYGCFTLCSYLFLHKSFIIQTKCNLLLCLKGYIWFKIFLNYIDNYFIISYNANNSSFNNKHINKRKNKCNKN